MARLGDVVLSVASRAPQGDTAFKYIDLSSVDAQSKTITGARSLAGIDAPSRARQVVAAGDILVSTVRPNLNGVAQVPEALAGAIASTGFTVLRAKSSEVEPKYLFHWVRGAIFVTEMVRLATGASYPAVSDAIVKNSDIPLPPLPEQRRIASILDQADQLREGRSRSLESAESVSSRVFDEWFGKRTSVQSLGSVSRRITDGTHQAPLWATEGVPFLFVSNLTSGRIDYETSKFVSETTYQELTKSAPIEVGDVLYTAVGSYGTPVSVDENRPFIFQRHIAHIKPDHGIVRTIFLRDALGSERVRRQADRVARGVAQKTVTLGDLSKLEIPQVTLDEQLEYERAVAGTAFLLQKQHEHLCALDELFASLQHRAFRGEL